MLHASLTWEARFLDARFRGNDEVCKGLHVERGDSRERTNDGEPGVGVLVRGSGRWQASFGKHDAQGGDALLRARLGIEVVEARTEHFQGDCAVKAG